MRTYTGFIVSIKDPKTAKVEVIQQSKHPLYKKIIFKAKRLLVDTENLQVFVGDSVVIGETRPVSKTKHFKVIKIIKNK